MSFYLHFSVFVLVANFPGKALMLRAQVFTSWMHTLTSGEIVSTFST